MYAVIHSDKVAHILKDWYTRQAYKQKNAAIHAFHEVWHYKYTSLSGVLFMFGKGI